MRRAARLTGTGSGNRQQQAVEHTGSGTHTAKGSASPAAAGLPDHRAEPDRVGEEVRDQPDQPGNRRQ